MLGAIESLLSAVVADGMIGGGHRSNMELVAQGVANIVSPLFGGIPATGAIARTATNVRNGGRTPVAGIGDRAYFLIPYPDDEYKRLGLLAVHSGSTVVQFILDAHGTEPIEATRPRLERLARLVVPRLP